MVDRSFVTCLAILLMGLTASFSSAAPTLQQRKAVKELQDAITEAGKLYVDGKYEDSAAAVTKILSDAEKMSSGGDPDLLKILKRPYDRLKTAHSLLELEGFKLPPFSYPAVPEPKKPTPTPATGGVSFVSQVVPVLTRRCGRCHVDKASGEFSMANYNLLMKGHPKAGLVVFKGDAPGSRLIEVIEGGEMPPGGGRLAQREVDILKKWIMEGAKYDGEDPTANLSLLAAATSTQPMTVEVGMPTGKETVSFAQHIAPILVENCNGCHINPANQARGRLNMTNFRGILRGGDTGPIIAPRNPNGSLLIAKLKGTAADGGRMPAGRPPLSDEQIALFEKWIAEGATMDSRLGPNESVVTIAAVSKAENSTHEELMDDRAAKSEEYWRLAMSGAKSDRVETTNFLVLGNVGQNTLKEHADAAEGLVRKVGQMLGAPANKPLIKGRMTLFVFQQRYDYSEFGKMVEQRDIPRNSRGHWRYTVIDAYGAVIPADAEDSSSNDSLIGQQLAGAYIASLGKLPPRWFSEGVARTAAERLGTRDPRVKAWDDRVSEIAGRMAKPDDFITGKMPTEDGNIISYSFVQTLMKNKRNFSTLLKALREGQDFDKSFTVIYGGTPNQLAQAWLRG